MICGVSSKTSIASTFCFGVTVEGSSENQTTLSKINLKPKKNVKKNRLVFSWLSLVAERLLESPRKSHIKPRPPY